MKVILVSDSHGKDEVLQDILNKYPNADAYIHCGDIETDASEFPQFVTVCGNNDIFFDYPNEKVLTLGKHRLFITHSHQFMFNNRVEQIAQKARSLDCDIACYGHTHVAHDESVLGVRVINPGSIWRSRDGRDPSYVILTLEDDDVDVEFVFLPQKKMKYFWQ
ncbi:MAG: metallophosphoesterase [Longicatena sp.]